MHPQPENSSSKVNIVCIVNLRYDQPQFYHFISILIFLKLIPKNLLTLDESIQSFFRALFLSFSFLFKSSFVPHFSSLSHGIVAG